jgi:SAM-dependent methyltransferase
VRQPDLDAATRPTATVWRVVRLFLRDRGASDEFAEALADRAMRQLPGDVDGRLVLDLGCGPGVYTRALDRLGATVISSEFDVDEVGRASPPVARPVVADGRRLPMSDGVIDCVVCSNVLEHTPEPFAILDEIARVLQPGGWAYVSWTNWLSPWGGHAVAPLHYLGPERSLRWWTRLFGPPRGRNRPLDGVWPTYIGSTLAHVRQHPDLDLVDAYPRYWPWLRVIMRVPGVREVASWNCVLVLRRRVPETAPH